MMADLLNARDNLKENPNDQFLAEELAKILSSKVEDLIREDKIPKITILLEELDELSIRFNKSKNIHRIYGSSVLNSLPIYFAHTTQTAVKQLINKLRETAIQTKSEPLTDILSMILVNAIYDFSLINQVGSINEFAIELSDLSKQYPTNERIQTAAAKGMMNATFYFIQNKDLQAARKYFQTLEKVLQQNQKKEFVDSRQLIQLREFFSKE